MLESNNPEIDVTQLLEKIGLELKLQQKGVERGQGQVVPEELEINDPYSWGQLNSTLNIAEQNVNAGAEVTTMLHYRGIVRKNGQVAWEDNHFSWEGHYHSPEKF